nr:hypothetical protein [Tanacetum cinerariifolium]
MSTPAKPFERKKHKRVELEDSDTDATPVDDEEAKDAITGYSSRKKKKKWKPRFITVQALTIVTGRIREWIMQE